VATQAADLLLGQEGAFGTHLLSGDIVDPPLMFGPAGVLCTAMSGLGARPGSGLSVVQPLPYYSAREPGISG
jgi:hypothetical protein